MLEARWGAFNESYPERDNIVKTLLIDKNIRSVLDLGAGNQNLQQFFTDKNIYYTPVDKYKRQANTLVFDFNQHNFPGLTADCVLALGILEYVEDTDWFVGCMQKSARKYIVFSYHCTEDVPDITKRKNYGWQTHISCSELLKNFDEVAASVSDGAERVFLVEKCISKVRGGL
jgi:hypothetical protein